VDHRSLRQGRPNLGAVNARRPMAMLWAGKFEHSPQQASWQITNEQSTDKAGSKLKIKR